MKTKQMVKEYYCNVGETFSYTVTRLVAVPTTKLEKAVIDFKFNSINDLGELDEELMIKALPKGKKREKALQFVMLMFPEVLNWELPIQAPSNLQFIATAVAMKKKTISKWLSGSVDIMLPHIRNMLMAASYTHAMNLKNNILGEG